MFTNVIPSTGHRIQGIHIPRCSMVLEYLYLHLPSFTQKICPVFFGRYSSTMEHLGILSPIFSTFFSQTLLAWPLGVPGCRPRAFEERLARGQGGASENHGKKIWKPQGPKILDDFSILYIYIYILYIYIFIYIYIIHNKI